MQALNGMLGLFFTRYVNKRGCTMLLMILGVLGLLSGGLISAILIIMGCKKAMDAQTKNAKEIGCSEKEISFKKKKAKYYAIFFILFALMPLIIYLAKSNPYLNFLSFESIRSDYLFYIFKTSVNSNSLKMIGNYSVFGSSKVKKIVFALSLFVSPVLYALFLIQCGSAINKITASNEYPNADIVQYKALCYVLPIVIVFGFYIINNINSFVALLINALIYKIKNNKIRMIIKIFL